MSRIFWDTNLFIYLLEGADERARKVVKLRLAMLERGDQLLTSALTLGEVLVKPIEQNDHVLRKKFEDAITSTAIVIPFDVGVARLYAQLRLDRYLRPPDAIQLACAGTVGVDLFITNDANLQ